MIEWRKLWLIETQSCGLFHRKIVTDVFIHPASSDRWHLCHGCAVRGRYRQWPLKQNVLFWTTHWSGTIRDEMLAMHYSHNRCTWWGQTALSCGQHKINITHRLFGNICLTNVSLMSFWLLVLESAALTTSVRRSSGTWQRQTKGCNHELHTCKFMYM